MSQPRIEYDGPDQICIVMNGKKYAYAIDSVHGEILSYIYSEQGQWAKPPHRISESIANYLINTNKP